MKIGLILDDVALAYLKELKKKNDELSPQPGEVNNSPCTAKPAASE